MIKKALTKEECTELENRYGMYMTAGQVDPEQFQYPQTAALLDIHELKARWRAALLSDRGCHSFVKLTALALLDQTSLPHFERYDELVVLDHTSASLARFLSSIEQTIISVITRLVDAGIIRSFNIGDGLGQGYTFDDRYLTNRKWKQKRPVRTKLREDGE
jgi:hypothetical protein